MGRGVWPNHHITFIVAKKLNLLFYLLYLRYMCVGGRGLVENAIWGLEYGGWLETSIWVHMAIWGLAGNVRIPSYKGEGI